MSFRVTRVSITDALRCCKLWHYTKTMPTAGATCYGVTEDGKPIGVVVYGMGANSMIHRPFGIMRHEAAELTRVALCRHKTPVSQIIAVTLRLLRKDCPSLRIVISYADTAQGHTGGIYKAGNWSYLGESVSSVPVIAGKPRHKRTISSKNPNGYTSSDWAVQKPKHKYAIGLDQDMKMLLQSMSKPYPCAQSIVSDAGTIHVQEGGATPTCALNVSEAV